MASVGDDGDGQKSSFRWLDAVRYVVAAVVVVLIVAVAANAIKVVLRPDTLVLSVPGGAVFTGRFPPSQVEGEELMFVFTLRALNPSGRTRMYYYNITAYLFDNTTTATESRSPSDDCLILFEVDDMTVLQMKYKDATVGINATRDPEVITPSFFDALYKPAAARINNVDVTMRVDGTLVTEAVSGFNTTPQLTTYYCRQLAVDLNLDERASLSSQLETRCTTS